MVPISHTQRGISLNMPDQFNRSEPDSGTIFDTTTEFGSLVMCSGSQGLVVACRRRATRGHAPRRLSQTGSFRLRETLDVRSLKHSRHRPHQAG